MQALVGGADCGPVNPLSQMTKAFNQDRSLQQDRFGPQPGSSNSAFRSSNQPSNTEEASRFFQQNAFDMTPLDQALGSLSHTPDQAAPAWAENFRSQNLDLHSQSGAPSHFHNSFVNPAQANSNSAWANDFMSSSISTHKSANGQSTTQEPQFRQGFGGPSQYFRPQMGGMMSANYMNVMNQPIQQQSQSSKTIDWEAAFQAQENSSRTQGTAEKPQQAFDPAAHSDLAATASQLLDQVRSSEGQRTSETNQKMSKSTFIELMRQIADGNVVVEGDQVVEQDPENAEILRRAKEKLLAQQGRQDLDQTREEEGRTGSASHPFGLAPLVGGPEMEDFIQKQHSHAQNMAQQSDGDMQFLWGDEDRAREARERADVKGKGRENVSFQGDGGVMEEDGSFLLGGERSAEQIRNDMSVPLASSYWDEDFDMEAAADPQWGALNEQWKNIQVPLEERLGVSSMPIKTYQFSRNNPYLEQDMTRTHTMHSQQQELNITHHAYTEGQSNFATILQLESELQKDANDASLWFNLGLRQQENEREDLAIAALQRSLALDPSNGAAYLALAISYSNENDRGVAFECLGKWLDILGQKEDYTSNLAAYQDMHGPMLTNRTFSETHTYLTNALIHLAQSRNGQVDPEVQTGLGVLFNSSEEFEKASDCFVAALDVSPDDHVMYNRLGATLANSGKTDLSIHYYTEALSLNPSYVRARFNLSVAQMNLGRYDVAVGHLMTALSIQEEDAQLREGADLNDEAAGFTSQSLWDSLNVALLMMQRGDLANMTIQRDLKGLKAHFEAAA